MEKKVRIYTTAGCHHCRQAKEYLTQNAVDFESFDVATDKGALEALKKIAGGARSLPVIAVGEEVILGFDKNALEKALKRLG